MYESKREAVLARYFGKNLLLAAGALSGHLIDGAVSVPVPEGSSQGLRPKFTTTARAATEEEFDGDDYDAQMAYLKDKGWWNITRPVDTAEDMMDLLQLLLACESWDWHSAAMAKVILCWAGLLSIVGLEKEANVGKFSPTWGRCSLGKTMAAITCAMSHLLALWKDRPAAIPAM